MKTVNNTKSAQRRHFPSLALLLAAVTLLAFAPASGAPLAKNRFTPISSPSSRPCWSFRCFTSRLVHRDRRLTWVKPLRLATIRSSIWPTAEETATYTLTAANGDTLVLALQVPVGGIIDVEEGTIFFGIYAITGGTGRFTAPPAVAFLGGSGLYLLRPMVSARLPSVGTISLPGSLVGRFPGGRVPPRASLSFVCVSKGKRWRDPLPRMQECGSIPPLRR